MAELASAGVRRISLGAALYRVAMNGLLDAALEVKDQGTFTSLERSIPLAELAGLMGT